jgi:23S rRNA (guanosine2251-2'-O)-methyltransferase
MYVAGVVSRVARLTTLLGPDAVGEAVRTRQRVVEIFLAEGSPAAGGDLPRLATAEGIPVRIVSAKRLAQEAGGRQADGVVAYVKSDGYATVDDVMAVANGRGEPALLVATDLVEDAQALGELYRVAEAAGAHGVLLPARSIGVTPAVMKASQGAVESVATARVPNLAEALGRLADRGVQIVGVDPEGEALDGSDLSGPILLVLPPEGHRLSLAVGAACTRRVATPFGKDGVHLPIGVVAGIVLYERVRRTSEKATRFTARP